jgi:hypothetical protein
MDCEDYNGRAWLESWFTQSVWLHDHDYENWEVVCAESENIVGPKAKSLVLYIELFPSP